MSFAPAEWPDALYSMPQKEKEVWLLKELVRLTEHHQENCEGYAHIVRQFFDPDLSNIKTLADLPFTTVSLFKYQGLSSVPEAERFKTLSSSGTSGVASQIVLDRDTAKLQMKALTTIMKDWLGAARRPMMIIDSQQALQDRTKLNARATATAGFSMFGTDHFYALDENLEPDWAGLEAFLKEHEGQKLFIFGFTFMVWQWLQKASKRYDLSNAFLLHGGGWKKLQDQAVSDTDFQAALRAQFGDMAIHNYYGMVEQVGSIFVAGEHGYFHPPVFADILIRDPKTLEILPHGEKGAIQILSLIPGSYPGHSLLSEDEGIIHGVDDSPCGRKGKYFSVLGRLQRAELKGCSDTRPEQKAEAAT